jgi:hypothetical protein
VSPPGRHNKKERARSAKFRASVVCSRWLDGTCNKSTGPIYHTSGSAESKDSLATLAAEGAAEKSHLIGNGSPWRATNPRAFAAASHSLGCEEGVARQCRQQHCIFVMLTGDRILLTSDEQIDLLFARRPKREDREIPTTAVQSAKLGG